MLTISGDGKRGSKPANERDLDYIYIYIYLYTYICSFLFSLHFIFPK